MTQKIQAKVKTAPKHNAPEPAKFPILILCIVAGVALMIGVGIGGNTGPAPVAAQNDSDSIGTPANEPVREQPQNEVLVIEVEKPLAEVSKAKDSLIVEALVVSDNTGTVNIGGTHIHEPPKRTPVTVIQPIREVIVERIVEPKPARIWTRPGIPAHSRLGRTLLTLKRFEDAGVRIYVEH